MGTDRAGERPVPPGPGPGPRLGAELKAVRSGLGLSLRAAAGRVGWSAATLSRTENGRRPVGIAQVSALLDGYEITGQRRERLLGLAREAGEPRWWEASGASGSLGAPGVPADLATLIGHESRATAIVEVQLVIIPGMLQIPEYTRALMRATGVRGQEAETRVALRLARQAVLTRPDPLRYTALLDEAVLHRPVGGAAVFARQLRQVVELADRPGITVQVLPYGCGAHAALPGAHTIMEFADGSALVHLEHRRGSVFLDRPADVRPYVGDVDTLRFSALDPQRSADLMAALAAEHEHAGSM